MSRDYIDERERQIMMGPDSLETLIARRLHRTQQHALSEIDVTKPYLVETEVERDEMRRQDVITVTVSGIEQ